MLADVTTPQDLDERFRSALGGLAAAPARPDPDAPITDGSALSGTRARELFEAQVASRHLDLAARWLRSFGEGYYTIGSCGHEGNAAVAAALRPTDPALLHYRSGAFYCVRAVQAAGGTGPDTPVPAAAAPAPPAGTGTGTGEVGPAGGDDGHSGTPGRHAAAGPPDPAGAPDGAGPSDAAGPLPAGDDTAGDPPPAAPTGPPLAGTGLATAIRDVLRGLVASAREPIAGGRHKVFGHPDLEIIPTTSTIASHLPRAVGIGFAIERGRRVRPGPGPAVPAGRDWPSDAVVVCSFGDASINHAAATAAFNTAGWCDHSGLRLPVLFVCEDNGLGISVRSPRGWVAQALRAKPGLRYLAADGTDLAAAYDAAAQAVQWVRQHRRPAILHLETVRLMGHAGADAEVAYRAAAELDRDLARDPLVRTAELITSAGLAGPAELLARYDEIGWLVRTLAEDVLAEPKLTSAAQVVAPLAPRRPVRVARAVAEAGATVAPTPLAGLPPPAANRARVFAERVPEQGGPLTLAQAVNATLTDALITWPRAVVFGQDVAVKGGVYGVTKGLRERFGASRVFDTLLDETSILGLGLGVGLAGMLPVPEIQYLAYLHNAEDQLRGEAASLSFFSAGAYRNPMVLRLPGLAYQEGFGGHFHNDNALGVLRDIPGLVIACPARPDDAAALLRTCLASAAVDGSVCVFLEPIALYHTRDLHEPGDGGWLAGYPAPTQWAAAHVPVGRARVDLVGSGADLTVLTFGNGVRMSLRVARRLAREGVGTRVVDLRWLAPLPVADIVREASATGRVLIVDETRRSGGVGEGVLAALVDAGYVGVARRVASVDSYLPIGPAATLMLVSEDSIHQGARSLLAGAGTT